MKNFIISLVLLVSFCGANLSFASESVELEQNLSAKEVQQERDEGITVPETVDAWLEIGKYFDTRYPGAAIDSDFSADVATVFPKLSLQEVYDKEETIRTLIKSYRYFTSLYEKLKAEMLVPEAPPLIVAENEYEEVDETREYIESDDVVVVDEFKKVLSYGGNPRDFSAYAAKRSRELQKNGSAVKNDIDVMSGLLKKLEWRKLPFYGIIYENPFTGTLGSGEWSRADGVALRLIAEYSTLNNQKEIKGGLHFDLPEGQVMLAQNYKEFQKPTFSFNDSQNLASAEYFYPAAIRQKGSETKDVAVYKGNFMLPLVIKVEDSNQPLKLKTQADFVICDEKAECKPQHLEAELSLQAGQGFYSSVNNFVTQSFNYLPQNQNSKFSLEKAVVDENGEDNRSQIIRLEFSYQDAPNNFDAYLEGKDNILFKRPRMAIGDNKITLRFEPVDTEAVLVGKEFTITARLNPMENLRVDRKIEKASLFDYMPASLSFGIILLAILGGFILNFMPCVFPVLSIKLLSLTRFGANRPDNVRRNFMLTVLGIFVAFEALAILLSGLKLTGQAVGWGMQFQNPYFLVFMIFAIVIFLAVVWGLIGLKTPDWLLQHLQKKGDKESWMHFFTGLLVVFMATPCTAPYLGTAIGFALGGNVWDIFVILNAVSVGLALPYLLVLAYPAMTVLLPKPGAWMEKLNFIMGLMLFLTLVWLLAVLYAQVGFWPVLRLSVYLLMFMLVLFYRRALLDAVDISEEEPVTKQQIRRLYQNTTLSVLVFVFALAATDVVWHFNQVQTERNIDKVKVIDYERIAEKIKKGKIVVVAIDADWCMTCKYNEVTVFSNAIVDNLLKNYDAELIKIDWTEYNSDVLEFMKKFGRQGLPFYVVFSPMVPDGMVLPEVLSEREFSRIIRSIAD